MLIVTVKHVNYNGTSKAEKYWFKSNDDLKCNDYVFCDTKSGCVKGIVCDVYKTIDELIEGKVCVDFEKLKECGKPKQQLIDLLENMTQDDLLELQRDVKERIAKIL